VTVRTYKYRAYPTPEQAEALTSWLRFASQLYNAALEHRKNAWGRHDAHGRGFRFWDGDAAPRKKSDPPGRWVYRGGGGAHISKNDQGKLLTEFRREHAELLPPGMPALVQHEVLARLERSMAAFFQRATKGQKAGYPRWRSEHRYDSLTFGLTSPSKERFDPETGESLGRGKTVGAGTYHNGDLRLTGLGELRILEHRRIPMGAIPKSVIVRRSGKRWFVSIAMEMPSVEPAASGRPAVGLDMGVVTWGTAFTADTSAAAALVADLRRMATDPSDCRRLEELEREAAQLSEVLAHCRARGLDPARPRRCPKELTKLYRRSLHRLGELDRACARIRRRLQAAHDIAEPVPDEAGSAVLIEGSNAGMRHARRVARTQRRVARRTRAGHAHSNRRKKAVQAYARAKERERSARGDHRHKVSRALVRQFEEISVEALDIKQLTVAPEHNPDPQPDLPAHVQRRRNRGELDAAWGAFFAALDYKAADAGGRVARKPAPHTTQECARCGTLVPKPISLRVHRCPACGYTAPRTVNSARNVLQRPLEEPGRAGPSGANGRGVPHAVA